MITKPTIYTEEFVLRELQGMEYWLWHTRAGKQALFLEEIILFMKKPYSLERISEWRKQFKDRPEIPQTIRNIKATLKMRLIKGGLIKKFDSGITKFCLINNYKWTDRVEENGKKTITHKTKDTIDYSKYTPEQLEQLEKLLAIQKTNADN